MGISFVVLKALKHLIKYKPWKQSVCSETVFVMKDNPNSGKIWIELFSSKSKTLMTTTCVTILTKRNIVSEWQFATEV